jgi:signal peptidase I
VTDQPQTATRRGTHREHAAPRRSTGMSWLRETAIILLSAVALSWLIKTFLVQAFFIPSASMEDTLQIGDRVLVSKLAPGPLSVHRGDVVVFKDPGGWLPPVAESDKGPVRNAIDETLTFVGLLPQDSGEHLIKRVIGVAGDRVVCCDDDGRITVNGEAIDEPYLKPGSAPSEREFDVTVPAGSLWVMGDNRQNSLDSRYHLGDPGGGSIPVKNVVGTSFVVIWPFDDMSLMRNPGATFEQVPEAP